MGVKSLWTLLTPVGRPILLETVEGKAMAIDSSIWIYQFQATMRDKEGRGLVNAHVLGFLRRITKLLFYGIKPVFVFDGGAPALKRSTLNERKKKKAGAALSHAKIAERLLAAQMRREALNQAQGNKASKGKGKEKAHPPEDIPLDDNTVYLEDIDSSMPKAPAKVKPKLTTPSSSAKKQNKYHDHDPYRLPEVDLGEAVAKATRANVPDPRLATEDELRAFIEEMRPEDFKLTSPEFRELPTEVQYEIIGDLRLKSRQTSHARLQRMLKVARTPMDFSKQQIINLKQRNELTQQLLVTTNSVGSAHLTIPVRIASERNKEYVLTKNEGAEGGWVLAIQDKTGTAPDQPILIDVEGSEDEDADMEEVDTANTASVTVDSDLREYQRNMALSAIAGRSGSKMLAPLPKRPINRKDSRPLFDLDADDEDAAAIYQAMDRFEDDDDDDEELAFAIQASLEQSRYSPEKKASGSTPSKPSSSKLTLESPRTVCFPDGRLPSSELEISAPWGLETALSFAGTGPRNTFSRTVSGLQDRNTSTFGAPSLLSPSSLLQSRSLTADVTVQREGEFQSGSISPPQNMTASPSVSISGFRALTDSEGEDEMEEVDVPAFSTIPPRQVEEPSESISMKSPIISSQDTSEDDEMEEVDVTIPLPAESSKEVDISSQLTPLPPISPSAAQVPILTASTFVAATASVVDSSTISLPSTLEDHTMTPLFIGSRSPSPFDSRLQVERFEETMVPTITVDSALSQEPIHVDDQEGIVDERVEEEHWDAANEMDPHAEEGEFARFLSHVKGRNLNEVRREIDDEIKLLNEQRKAAMRDSEDITQQMISQIMTMLRLFGIPYITAPMEAEAQCAELVSLGLVDGVITDDSDVFLFGAQRVYKNMFNQSKTVELFLQSDLERELGLDRDTLVRLAYLLGSDYTEGLVGTGPVLAMELLREFPGKEGLHRFADWWRKVQEGKDKEGESVTKFRRQFKKKFKDLFLPVDWPNPAVRDAYYHPTVDSSDEPFKWGLPDLDALRMFFSQELGWGQGKVDELLLPIIQKMNRRQTNTSGTSSGLQGNLSDWVSVHARNNSAANLAPRKKEVYTSRRLQQVVADFRKKRKAGSVAPSQRGSTSGGEEQGGHAEATQVKKRQRTTIPTSRGGQGGRRRGRGIRNTGSRVKRRDDDDYTESSDEDIGDDVDAQALAPAESRPRPRPRPRPVPQRSLPSEDDVTSDH